MERRINAPDPDYLTEQEAAAWLRIDEEDFREFVRMGVLPGGIPWGKQSRKHRWPWLDVIAVGHLLGRGFLHLPGESPPQKSS